MSNFSLRSSEAATPAVAEKVQIHVCHIGPYPNRGGGIASVTRMLSEYQQADPSLSVETFATSVDGSTAEKLVSFAKSVAAIRVICKRANNLVLHIHTSHSRSFHRKALLMKIAKRYNVPVLLHIHGSVFDTWYEAQSASGKRSIRKRLDGVGHIVVVSDSWNDYISKLTSTPVTTVHNAVNVADFAFDRSYADPQTFVLLFLGGVGLRRKGAFDLLEAIERISRDNSTPPMRVIIAGHGEINEVKKWIQNHGLDDTVTVPGWIDRSEKDQLLRNAHIFVLPSYHEGLPIALLESMASALPIVISPVGGIPEAIQDDENGLFVPAGDVDKLAAALKSVLQQPALRERLGSRAQQTAREFFDLPVAASTFKALYAELCPATQRRL